MHAHVIDWLRKIHLNADTAFGTQRWKLAESVAEGLSRSELLQVLRAFLFPKAPEELIHSLTQRFLSIDKEFPPANNAEDVRLQAGIIIVAATEERTRAADAFALGVRASDFPMGRCQPAQVGVIDEALQYLAVEANVLRPSDFERSSGSTSIKEKLRVFSEALPGGDPEASKKANAELCEALEDSYGRKIERLAEESGLLWWLLCGHSPTLNREITSVGAEVYALVAAAEVAERTQIVPPPPSVYALLTRALALCKRSKRRESSLQDLVGVANPEWRSRFVASHPVTECADLVPLITALKITEEAGDTDTLSKLLPKRCPGISADLPLKPLEAAHQLYSELTFLRALQFVI